MSETCETVKIVSAEGTFVINKSDYDPTKHRLEGETEKQPEKQPLPQLMPMKEGKKYFIVDLTGKRFEGGQFADVGYDNEAAAWEAIKAATAQV